MAVVMIPVRLSGRMERLDAEILRDPRIEGARKEGLVSAEVLRKGADATEGLLVARWDGEREDAPRRLLESMGKQAIADQVEVAGEGQIYYGER